MGAKLPVAAEASELSNSSLVDSDSNVATTTTTTTPSISLSLADFFPGTRKKRNRQAQQQLQEQLDLINEIDTWAESDELTQSNLKSLGIFPVYSSFVHNINYF